MVIYYSKSLRSCHLSAFAPYLGVISPWTPRGCAFLFAYGVDKFPRVPSYLGEKKNGKRFKGNFNVCDSLCRLRNLIDYGKQVARRLSLVGIFNCLIAEERRGVSFSCSDRFPIFPLSLASCEICFRLRYILRINLRHYADARVRRIYELSPSRNMSAVSSHFAKIFFSNSKCYIWKTKYNNEFLRYHFAIGLYNVVRAIVFDHQ